MNPGSKSLPPDPAMPRFSIVITCFNQRLFIRDAIGSALIQDHRDKEIVVVDDGSTDGSREVLAEYADSVRVECFKNNQGAASARNMGASLSSGDFLVFLDGDDVMLPWALKAYDRIVAEKQPKLILAKMLWFEGRFSSVTLPAATRIIKIVQHPNFMKKDRPCRASASALIVERKSFDAVAGWSKDVWPLEDAELMIRLGDSGPFVQVVSPPTVAYRIHSGNTVHDVHRMCVSVLDVVRRSKSGQYTGRGHSPYEESAVLGGIVSFWIRRACQARCFGEAARLTTAGWRLVLSAVLRKCVVGLRGRYLIEEVAADERL